jgi:hypothetical protein
MERLNYEDGYLLELLVDKINELVDKVNEMEESIDRRISAHWKYHRINSEKKSGGE